MEWTIDKMGVDNGRTKTLKWRKRLFVNNFLARLWLVMREFEKVLRRRIKKKGILML